MNNQFGHFKDNGKEFVITTPNIPRHWYNYLWNDNYITFISQVGFGEGLIQDELGRRVNFLSNRNVYLLDSGTNSSWTANGMPLDRGYSRYSCIHGQGYTEINLEYESISSTFRVFVPDEANCEIWTIKVKNNGLTDRSLKVIPYVRTEMDGNYRPQGYNTDIGFFNPQLNAVVGRSYAKHGSDVAREVYGYIMGGQAATGYDSRKNAFIGPYGDEMRPQALKDGGCQKTDCIAEKLCFALENTVHLKSEEECELHFVVGIGLTMDELESNRQRFLAEGAVSREFVKTVERFSAQNHGVNIQTPDTDINDLFNGWLKHQTNMGSRWARVRHNGFRDLTSDCECLGAVNPDLAWIRLKRVLAYQYSNGYAPRTFLDGTIRDNNFSDNTVWLTFAVYSLLMEIGDLNMLTEEVPFNDGSVATVYEHLKRSVEFLWNFKGLHGLIKIWGGDWNDMMNEAGLKGKGVSVWLSIAWYRANSQFGELAALMGETADAELAESRGREMKETVDRYGWDGEYYLDAYTDDNVKIGSSECTEGKVFLIPQLWAVLSGISKDGKDLKAMDAIDKYLETSLGTTVSWPSYTHYMSGIGGMTQKPAGVHENGGVYLHPATWKLAVDSILKRNDKVQVGLEKILPFNTKWEEKLCEPYVICNSYFTEETGYRYRSAGQSWRTASGAWLTKALVNYVFGIKPKIKGLSLEPCLPTDWKVCSIAKEFRGATYHIRYEQMKEGGCNHIHKLMVNGVACNAEVLPYEKGVSYEVQVFLD